MRHDARLEQDGDGGLPEAAAETGARTRTHTGIGRFREAVRDQPLVMAAVMLGVGYFLRTLHDLRPGGRT